MGVGLGLGGGLAMVEFGAAIAAAGAASVVAAGMLAPVVIRRAEYLGASDPKKCRNEAETGRVDIVSFENEDIGNGAAALKPGVLSVGKRAFDIACAVALIVFLAPVLLLTALAIKLDSKGPVLYRQRRVGLSGKEFDIFKFRSMREDAERNGAQWAATNDDRITRVGKFIRRTRIDEIPQAINILKGEMSFVGPRPERPEFVRVLETEIPNYHSRHVVKPGITGWAQVRHEYTASVEGARDKLSYDLFYIKHFSPLLDLAIVFMTVRVALLGIGSR
jgi:exopolysaccharide biosynthesis polyprenyl glycosylphosphotransferase